MNATSIATRSGEDPLPGILTTATIAVALRPLAQDAYTGLKNIITTHRLKMKVEVLRQQLQVRVQFINEVKTLLCLETPVPLTDFYSPQHLTLPDDTRVEVRSLNDIADFSRCVISGTAGQGKSILFRYLALQEVIHRRLPIFVELRNLAHQKDVSELIDSELTNLGFEKHSAVFDHLLHQSSTTIFLDAFDEIPPAIQAKARKDIEDLSRRYPEARFLISSRPALIIESSPFFRVARMAFLTPQEATQAMKRMCRESDDPTTVEKEIGRSNHQLGDLLNTPLMVALLLLHYRLTHKFPETEQSFFDDLFDVLLRRHDQTKGYVRQRYSKATEAELSATFGYMCFLCRKAGEIEISRPKALVIAGKANAYFQQNLDSAGVVDDIIHGTNLILEEGSCCRFAHKSIQEFYAAAFLTRQSEDHVSTFLTGKIQQWDMWEQFLRFMSILDRYKFLKYFLVPHIGWIAYGEAKKQIPQGWNPSKKAYHTIFGRDAVGIKAGAVCFHGCAHLSICYLLRSPERHTNAFWESLRRIDWASVRDELSTHEPELQRVLIGNEQVAMYPMHLLLKSSVGDEIRKGLKTIIDSILPEIFEAYAFLDYRSEQTELFS